MAPITDTGQEATDSELLRDYVAHNSQASFTALVQRHIRLVYSVALRQLGNTYQAEEVTQAVFIILARKAQSLRPGIPLSGWLYETARLTAANYVRSEMRRRRREQEALMQSEMNQSQGESVWAGLAPLLDEAMGKLRTGERDAVVLHFFEGRTFSEVAAALGSTEDAVRKRVGRALEKLQAFFGRRGVKVSAGVLVSAMATHSLQAAPAGLAATVAPVAALKGAGAGASTMAVVKGGLKFMAWTKAKTAIVVSACVLAAGTTTVVVCNHENTLHTMRTEWAALSGDSEAWSWQGDKLTAHTTGFDAIFASSKKYRDMTLSAYCFSTNREASLAFRMQDAHNGYLVIFGPSGTPHPYNPTGQIMLIKRVDDREVELGAYRGRIFSSLGYAAEISVTAKGPWMEVRLNGVTVVQAKDSTFAEGRIGLRIFGDADYPCDAVFSRVTFRREGRIL
jgi:RNA polymerase sigma factor (sigma-70 family)